MKKYIKVAFTALLALVMFSCKKDADVASTEAKLPAIQLSSLGTQQTGPFTTTTVLQLMFGATATNTPTGRFTVEILDGSTIVKTVNFASWSGYDDTSDPNRKPTPLINHTISYTLQPTTYPNTNVYGGSIVLKLSLLGLTSGKTYNVRITGYGKDETKKSTLTQSSFLKIS